MKMPFIQGRLFMVVVFSTTFCIGWFYALYTAQTPEAVNSKMGVMGGLVTVIVMAYFNRQDREQPPPPPKQIPEV